MADSESSGTTYQAEESNNNAVRSIYFALNHTVTNTASLALFLMPKT